MSKPSAGFIGVEKTGHGMAKNSSSKDLRRPVLWHRNRALVAIEGSDPADVAARSDCMKQPRLGHAAPATLFCKE